MDLQSVIQALATFLDTPLLVVSAWVLRLSDLLLATAVVAATWIVGRWAEQLARRMFTAESEEEKGARAVAETTARWSIRAVGAVLFLMVLNVNMAALRDTLQARLFPLGQNNFVRPADILFAAVVVALTWTLSRLLRRALDQAFRTRQVDEGTTAITKRLLHYVVMLLGLAMALQHLGVNLAVIFGAGAVFAVGFGFAMQNIAQNFVSGIILLVERSIKPGDVLQVEAAVVLVEKMGIRATVARTRDEEEIIIPNSTLVQNSVKNYTLRDSLYRLRALVGVEYGSDVRQVFDVLKGVADATEWRFKGRDPVVLLTDFGDSSVNFEVSVWMQDPWTAPRARSDLNRAVWYALKDASVTIAFPQLDVHFDAPIEDAARNLPRAS